jgi:hypothetical protein
VTDFIKIWIQFLDSGFFGGLEDERKMNRFQSVHVARRQRNDNFLQCGCPDEKSYSIEIQMFVAGKNAPDFF